MRTIDEHIKRGEYLAKSGLFECSRPEQGVGISIYCEDAGISLQDFRNRYYFADGLMQPRANFMLAEFRRNGGRHRWVKDGSDGKAAEIELTTRDGETFTASYSIDEAQKRGLVKPKSAWITSPGEMLRARAVTRAINMACPEIGYAETEPGSDSPLPPKQEESKPLLPPKEEKEPLPPSPSKVKKAEKQAEPEPQPEPEPEKAEEPKAETPVEDDSNPELIPTEDASPTLSDELVEQLEEALEGIEVQACEWLVKEGQLKKGQSIAHLSEKFAKRIIKNRESFAKRIGAVK